MTIVSELLRKGRARDAVAVARKTVSSAPGDTAAYATLAHALMGHRDYDAAERAVSTALQLAPGEPALLFLRTRVNFARGRFEDARADASLALTASQKLGNHFYTESCRLLEAACLSKVGERQRAVQVLQGIGDDVKVMAGQLLTRDSVLQQAMAPAGQGSPGEPLAM